MSRQINKLIMCCNRLCRCRLKGAARQPPVSSSPRSSVPPLPCPHSELVPDEEGGNGGERQGEICLGQAGRLSHDGNESARGAVQTGAAPSAALCLRRWRHAAGRRHRIPTPSTQGVDEERRRDGPLDDGGLLRWKTTGWKLQSDKGNRRMPGGAGRLRSASRRCPTIPIRLIHSFHAVVCMRGWGRQQPLRLQHGHQHPVALLSPSTRRTRRHAVHRQPPAVPSRQ